MPRLGLVRPELDRGRHLGGRRDVVDPEIRGGIGGDVEVQIVGVDEGVLDGAPSARFDDPAHNRHIQRIGHIEEVDAAGALRAADRGKRLRV